MTVIRPNSVAGINSITVQSGNSLSVHKSDGTLIQTIVGATGVSTFSSISVGTATTDNSAGKSINIGLGASISQHDDNTLTFGTAGDPQVVLDATGHLVFPNNGKGVVFGATSGSNRPSITGSYTSSSNNHLLFNVTGEERARINSSGQLGIGTDAPEYQTTIAADGANAKLNIKRKTEASSNNNAYGSLFFTNNLGTDLASVRAQRESANTNAFLSFSTHNGSSLAERARINSSGDVGIGTDTMNAPLTVVQNDNAGYIASFRQKHASNSAQIIIDSPSDSNIRPTLIDLAQAGTVKWSLGQAYAAQSSQAFHIATSSLSANDTNAKLTITTAGAVGISSLIPRTGFKLDVNGDLSLGESGGTDNTYLEQKQNGDLHIINSGRDGNGGSNTAGAGGIGINRYNTLAGGTSYFRDLTVYDGKNSKILVVDGSANAVGVGTDSPQDTLDVANTVPQIRLTDLSDGSYGQIRANGGNLILRADEGNSVGGSIINFEIDGDEKSRITSDGFFLIGTASEFTSVSYRRLQIGTADGGWINLARTGTPSSGNHVGAIHGFTKSPDGNYHDTIGFDFKAAASASNTSKPTRMEFFTTPVDATTKEEVMRISEIGQVCIGNATQNASPFTVTTIFNVQRSNNNVASMYHVGTNNNPVLIVRHQRAGSSGNTAVQIQFNNTNGSMVGSIQSSASGTSYNTSSDYRLKENAVSISDGITRLKTLKPYRFNFKAEPSKTVDGFFAHEVTAAVPEAISGTKDAIVTQAMIDSGESPKDSKLNDPLYQEIDQAKIVPLLTAALQEAITKIETLETKVAALEGG